MLTTVAAAISVLLLSEVGLRMASSILPDPVRWYDARTQVKVEQMDALHNRDEAIDFVFVGTSMVFRGIDPHAFDAAGPVHTSSYNAGMLAGMPPVMERWVLEEVEPRLEPEVVVYGLSSLDLHEGRYRKPLRAYENAPATRKGPMASLERLGYRLLELVHRRGQLRDPRRYDELHDAIVDRKKDPIERTRATMTEKGFQAKVGKAKNNRERDRLRDQVLEDFSISKRGTKSIVHIARELKRRGVEVVFVNMPIPDGYVDLLPKGSWDYAAARDHLNTLAERLDVPFIDLGRTMDGSMFADYTHLTARGAEKLGVELKTRLTEMGY